MLRTRCGRLIGMVVLAALGSGSIAGAPRQALPESQARARVALYDGPGLLGPSADDLVRALSFCDDVAVSRVSPAEIRSGSLGTVDLLVMPGGIAYDQSVALGSGGREAVREFVAEGGGYLGVCAGGYLAATGEPWKLGLIDARTVDGTGWRRGEGWVTVRLTLRGQGLLGMRRGLEGMYFQNGPLFAPADDPAIPDFRTVATFERDPEGTGLPCRSLEDQPAGIAGRYGLGRVFCFSPHPESGSYPRRVLFHAVRAAARRNDTEV